MHHNFLYTTRFYDSSHVFNSTLLGVIVGFALAVIWDIWKRNRDKKDILKRTLRAIKKETENNLLLLRENVTLLEQDDLVIVNNAEIVRPLNILLISAGETAFLNGALEEQYENLSADLSTIYSNIHVLNHRIEARELYRVANKASSGYHSSRKLINEELKHFNEFQEKSLSGFLVNINSVNFA